MAATTTAVFGKFGGSSVSQAFKNVGGGTGTLDILQIINPSGSVLLNVTSGGVVHNPASSASIGTRIGQFETKQASGTTAQLFADAFKNPAYLDIVQVSAEGNPTRLGELITYYLDYLGVAY